MFSPAEIFILTYAAWIAWKRVSNISYLHSIIAVRHEGTIENG